VKHSLRILVAAATTLGLLMVSTLPSGAVSSTEELRNAPVPSLCEYPAGTLVDGELPGVAPGNVTLNASVLGNLISGGGTEAVSTFWCSHGGIGWPDNAVFYNGATKVVGKFDSGSVGHTAGRQTISKVRIADKQAVLTVLAVPRSGDNELWGSSGAQVVYRWSASKQRMTKHSEKIYTETATAKKIIEAAKDGKRSTVRKYATASATAWIMDSIKDAQKRHAKITFSTCYGIDSFEDVLPDTGVVQLGQRGCVVKVKYPHGDGTVPHVLLMQHRSSDTAWKSWVAVDFVPIWH
jgi:hypothetical protein